MRSNAATVDLEVQSRFGAKPVVVPWGITFPEKLRTTFEFKRPISTMIVSDEHFGENGWLLEHAKVDISTFDFSSKGIAAIEIAHEQDEVLSSWTEHNDMAECSFKYEVEGISHMHYRARDKDFNEEFSRSRHFKVDTRDPVFSITINKHTFTRVEWLDIHVEAYDPMPGSGLALSGAFLDGGWVVDGQQVDQLWFPLGEHVLEGLAVDQAGRLTPDLIWYDLIATRESMVKLADELRNRGEITSDDVADELMGWAEVGAWDNFMHTVVNNEGDSISWEAVDVLIEDAFYVSDREWGL